MQSIYTAVYVCKFMKPAGLPGYNNVALGLPNGSMVTDILLRGTLSRFVEGKEYLVTIQEIP